MFWTLYSLMPEDVLAIGGTEYCIVICIYQLLGRTYYAWRIVPSCWLR